MYPLRNFFALAAVAPAFLKVYRSQFQFKKERGRIFNFWKHVKIDIPDLDKLNAPLQRRIAHYLHANSVTTQWFSILHNISLTQSEREAGWYLAIATPIADYLVDKEALSLSQIQGLLDNSYSHPYSKLAQTLYQRARSVNPHPGKFDEYLTKTLEAQAASLQQNKTQVSEQTLKTITWNKGGYALLLYRTALKKELSLTEHQAIWQLGGLMQMHNDIFDLYRDLQENITTLASATEEVSVLAALFAREIEHSMKLFREVQAKPASRLKFFLLLHLAVGTGFICLDQYRQLEKKYGRFDPGKMSRAELVCDMEDISKISKTVLRTIFKNYSHATP